jgi:hypothetical protein
MEMPELRKQAVSTYRKKKTIYSILKNPHLALAALWIHL